MTEMTRDNVNLAAVPWESAPVLAEERRLVSLYTPVSGLGALDFLRGTRGQERFYFAEPGGESELAGVGVAAELVVPPILGDDAAALPFQRFDDIEAQARRLFDGAILLAAQGTGGNGTTPQDTSEARPRLFGGFAFQDDFVPDNTWSLFNPAEFTLPHYQFARRGDAAFLTINALIGPGDSLADTVDGLSEALAARLAHVTTLPAEPPRPAGLRYPMTYDLWRGIVHQATGAIRNGHLQKVVLARVCEVRTAAPIDAVAPLEYLTGHYGDCYRFLFEPHPHHAFFGATPELLVRKAGRAVSTMALAGSIGRGPTPAADDVLAAQLLSSAKDRHEHQLVVDAIRANLNGLALEPPAAAPSVLRLRNIQHLLTSITGHTPGVGESVLRLACRLHPTPAMGGAPSDEALAFLRRAEPVPRGWYAAPIGWLDGALDGAFAVAIRSAVTQHDRAWLYAGAGIVGASEPDAEWAETALKFRPMLGALGAGELR